MPYMSNSITLAPAKVAGKHNHGFQQGSMPAAGTPATVSPAQKVTSAVNALPLTFVAEGGTLAGPWRRLALLDGPWGN